jgi:hypothetical protein
MSRDAPAMRASNSAPWPVVPITIGTRAARHTLSARNDNSGREKSIATWALARSGGRSPVTFTPIGPTPASSPTSSPADLLVGEAAARTISSSARRSPLDFANACTMAVPMRPVAPINAALVKSKTPLCADSVPHRSQSCETAAP